jgi:hypothetical protein
MLVYIIDALFRHAVKTTQIAAVGNGEPHVVDFAPMIVV